MSDFVLCPTCTQPAAADHEGIQHCRNEACPEYGQVLSNSEANITEDPYPGSDLISQ